MQGEARLLACRYCGEVFDSMPKLAAHISNHHSSKRGQGEIIGLLRELLEEARKINQNLEEVRSLLNGLRVAEFTRVETVRRAEMASGSRAEEESRKNLPSFLKDNPWVDILSRRDRLP
ncbi:MAG: C2H2-type zinc finger protein [Nitrososphaerota archaeon]